MPPTESPRTEENYQQKRNDLVPPNLICYFLEVALLPHLSKPNLSFKLLLRLGLFCKAFPEYSILYLEIFFAFSTWVFSEQFVPHNFAFN